MVKKGRLTAKEEATPKRLREVFDIVNRKCYRGRLKLGKLGFRQLSSIAMVRIFHDGRRKPSIYIHSNMRWSLKLSIHELLHEMVHLAKPNLAHGEKFYREIVRLRRVACIDGDSW